MKKAAFLLLIFLLLEVQFNYAQTQWSGSTTTGGIIDRSGNIKVNGGYFGRYGGPLVGDTNPFTIYIDESAGTHEFLFFGNNTANLHLRLLDGDLKIGPSSIPTAVLSNNGSASFTGGVYANNLKINGQSGLARLNITQSGGTWTDGIRLSLNSQNWDMVSDNSGERLIIAKNQNIVDGFVIHNGIFGIGTGTLNNSYKLNVNGKILAEELKVVANVFPDYVFAPEYKLSTLEEVESFIKEHHHLPNIPSADDVQKNGLLVGEMNVKLLEKIEEMTLYLIELKKENIELRERVNTLEKKQ